ncbi:MAG: hypothetical protein AAGJ12_12210, partial [Bacteroidota bacterium]
MQLLLNQKQIFLLVALLLLMGCSKRKKDTLTSDPFLEDLKQVSVLDFEEESLSDEVTSEDADISIINSNATSGSGALQ